VLTSWFSPRLRQGKHLKACCSGPQLQLCTATPILIYDVYKERLSTNKKLVPATSEP
jgi:hypothetical protein